MATIKDLQQKISGLEHNLKKDVPKLIAHTAAKHYKARFEANNKDWNKTPWPNTKQPVKRGSLMMRSGNLQSSIRPLVVNPDRVVISAGSNKVPYAQIHNEGGTIQRNITVTPKMRKFAWAKFYETEDSKWKGMALTKKTSIAQTITMPKRQFMGMNDQLLNEMDKQITSYINHKLK